MIRNHHAHCQNSFYIFLFHIIVISATFLYEKHIECARIFSSHEMRSNQLLHQLIFRIKKLILSAFVMLSWKWSEMSHIQVINHPPISHKNQNLLLSPTYVTLLRNINFCFRVFGSDPKWDERTNLPALPSNPAQKSSLLTICVKTHIRNIM